ncbi:MAG: glutamate--cysteine ligase [Gammaproteobacteria bacterium]|jgi:glutamate--cysteine ligase
MNEIAKVPHLTTALTGPFQNLERSMLDNQATIETWFRNEWRETHAPFYASVDLRNAGYKIAPVDTNLFPAGFNNLNPAFEALCIQAIQMAVEHIGQPIDKVLIIPENHTRNLFYLENIASLQSMIEKAGFETRIGSLMPELESPMKIDLKSSKVVVLEPVSRDGDRVVTEGFNPDLILLNNDLASGVPELLNNIEQPITPPMGLGWSTRLKSDHFSFYQRVAQEFASLINIDPWLIDPMFRNCGQVDFMKRDGIECLTKNIESLLTAIKKKYEEHDVKSEPFVMVKADAGTYGMGVMTVKSPDEIVELNRKERTKMATTKEGQKVTQVIIQEGVYTHETWGEGDTAAEPVVYMLDHQVVGGFYRVHEKRSTSQNLNAPGMRFEQLAFDDSCISPDPAQDTDCHQNRFYTYGVLARLALLAAAREIASVT